MYIVPILKHNLKGGANITQYWLFLERNGNHLIELEDTDATAFASANAFAVANDLPLKGGPLHCLKEGLIFLEVDPAAMQDLSSFYSWNEVAPGTSPLKELWRPFLWITEGAAATADPWGVNAFLKEIQVGDEANLTVHFVLSTYIAAAKA